MSRFLQTDSSRIQHLPFPRSSALLLFLSLLMVAGCGAVACPEPLSDVDGTCQELEPVTNGDLDAGVERCDGVDNDGDTLIDEAWPKIGEVCGEGAGVGECVEGEYVCAEDGRSAVCEGALGPSDEVCDGKDNDCDGTPDNGPEETCDGKDNDCDGLVDEGVLSVKGEVFADHATVTAVEGGFAVARIIAGQLRIETYDLDGKRTGHHDDIESPIAATAFLESDSAGPRMLVALGRYAFHVVDVDVDADLVPVISGAQELHSDWRQGIDFGIYDPPYHPRLVAAPPRFLGYRDAITFALNPFVEGDLWGLTQSPTLATELPIFAVFAAAGAFVVWEQSDNLRAGWLLDDGALLLDIDVARGNTPGIAIRGGGPGVVYLQDGTLRLSELGGLTLRCREGGYCNERIEERAQQGEPSGPTGLAFDLARDTWFVVAGTELAVLGRGELGGVVTQAVVLDALTGAPSRVDVAVSGATAAVVQATETGESALTFLGCF
jgi:Putative metal-binding motif